jgi:hypothetical protein
MKDDDLKVTTGEATKEAVESDVSVEEIDDGRRIHFFKMQVDRVAQLMADRFKANDYKLESGEVIDGTYGTGSDLMRILFGAFAKRYKFNVKVFKGDNETMVDVTKDTVSKVSGGLLGNKRYNDEFEKLVKILSSEVN